MPLALTFVSFSDIVEIARLAKRIIDVLRSGRASYKRQKVISALKIPNDLLLRLECIYYHLHRPPSLVRTLYRNGVTIPSSNGGIYGTRRDFVLMYGPLPNTVRVSPADGSGVQGLQQEYSEISYYMGYGTNGPGLPRVNTAQDEIYKPMRTALPISSSGPGSCRDAARRDRHYLPRSDHTADFCVKKISSAATMVVARHGELKNEAVFTIVGVLKSFDLPPVGKYYAHVILSIPATRVPYARAYAEVVSYDSKYFSAALANVKDLAYELSTKFTTNSVNHWLLALSGMSTDLVSAAAADIT
ncbi:hypothetical protein B0H17DRAFT_1235141 [Mycena rosella]|uniref:Uncharacterized protein n=1 Tax=Mycena rosella TaxID=1033263 RepID=A0AAD7GBE5_MYCRO|nr:hypothetical protein B0H17DRAFT_1235141 [Mycena rosella]